MKVYTRKGDLGYTYDLTGKKIAKDNIKIISWGKIDELQAAVDLAILKSKGKEKLMLQKVQKKLGQSCAEIAGSSKDFLTEPVTEQDLVVLEKFIDGLGEPPHQFIRMNTMDSIIFNECRVRCRAMERSVVPLLRKKIIRPVVYKYINRLSSLFFMQAYRRVKK